MSFSGVPGRLRREWALTDQWHAISMARELWESSNPRSIVDVAEQLVEGVDDLQSLCFGFDRDRLLPEFTD